MKLFPFFSADCRKCVESHGVDMREGQHAVLTTLKYGVAWRSTAWWQNTKTMNMKVDPKNHTIWKHKWSSHNRGCVWDKIASEWSGKEERCNKRKRCQKAEDKRGFVTFAMLCVKHQVAHRRCKTQQREERATDTGTASRIDFTSH